MTELGRIGAGFDNQVVWNGLSDPKIDIREIIETDQKIDLEFKSTATWLAFWLIIGRDQILGMSYSRWNEINENRCRCLVEIW